jgi:hypothetical protein
MRPPVIFLIVTAFALTAFAAPKPDPRRTTLVQKPVAGGIKIVVTLRDKLGRNIGPGQASHLAFIVSSRKLPGPDDQGDGTYASVISGVPANDPVVTVTYDGVPVAKSEIVPPPRKHR